MSDNAFSAPGSAQLPPTTRYPTLVRGLAITAIVLGSLGTLFALYGTLSTVLTAAGVIATQPPPTLPANIQAAFTDLMEAQRGVAVYALFPTVLSGLVSVFMIVAGVQSLQRKEVGLMAYAALGAAFADLISYVLMQIVNYFLMQPAIEAYFDAILTLGGGAQAEMLGNVMRTTMIGSVAFGVLIGLTFVGFWIWAFITLNNHDRRVAAALAR